MKIIITMIVSALLASGASAHSKVSTTTPSDLAHLVRSMELEITAITAVLVATATLTSVLTLPM